MSNNEHASESVLLQALMSKSKQKYQYGIENKGHVSYVRYKCNNPNIDKDLINKTSKSIYNLERSIMSMYMIEMPECHVDNIESDIFSKPQPNNTDIFDTCKAVIAKLPSGGCSFRMVSPERTTVVTALNTSDDPNEDDIHIVTYEYIDGGMVLVRRLDLSELDNGYTNILGPVVISKKHSRADQFIKAHKLTNVQPMMNDYITFVNNLLTQFINSDKIDYPFKYNRSEMEIFVTLGKLLKVDVLSTSATRYITRLGDNLDQDRFDHIDNLRLNYITNEVVPQVVFSKKEWDFVFNYAEKFGLMDDKNGTRVDLRPILTDPKYGNVFEFDYPFDSAEKTHLVGITQYYPEEDVLKIIIAYDEGRESTNFMAIRQVTFIDISNFNIKECMIDTISKIQFPFSDDIPSSAEEVSELIPECIVDQRLGGDLCAYILSILLIIHDRPKRHRVVREEKSLKPTHTSGRKKSSKQNTTNNVVISRILMPLKDVDRYISERQGRGEDQNERNYIVESWNRVGHWRHYKSGKTVYINETTCTRRKELNKTAEVKIKL